MIADFTGIKAASNRAAGQLVLRRFERVQFYTIFTQILLFLYKNENNEHISMLPGILIF